MAFLDHHSMAFRRGGKLLNCKEMQNPFSDSSDFLNETHPKCEKYKSNVEMKLMITFTCFA